MDDRFQVTLKTDLHKASEEGDYERVKSLICWQGWCHLDPRDSSQRTPLHWAAAEGHAKIVNFFLLQKSQSELKYVDDTERDDNLVDAILHLRRRKWLVNCQDNNGRNVLHLAVIGGHTRTVKRLMDEPDIDLNVRDEEGRTALHWAMDRSSSDVVEVIMNEIIKRVEYKRRSYSYAPEKEEQHVYRAFNVNASDNDGRSVLHLAALRGYDQIIKLLKNYTDLLWGESIHMDPLDGYLLTPLHLAAEMGHLMTVEKLLEPFSNINSKDMNLRTPLHQAILKGHIQVAKLLVARCVNVDAGNISYLNAASKMMFQFATQGYPITKNQLNQALNVENDNVMPEALLNIYGEKQPVKCLFLIISDSNHNIKRLELLKKLGVAKLSRQEMEDILKQKEWGISALGLACKNNFHEIVEYLIKDFSADINAGIPTPFWHAVNGGHEEVVKILIRQKGLDFTSAAPDGMTPLMMVMAKDHLHLLPYFEQLLDGNSFQIVRESIKFGKNDQVYNRIKSALEFSAEELACLMTEAIMSDCTKTFEQTKKIVMAKDPKLFKETVENLQEMVEKRNAREIREQIGVGANLQSSELTKLTRTYPAFNAEIEEKWTQGWNKPNVDLAVDIGQKVLKRPCCLSSNVVSAMELINCGPVCQQKKNCALVRDLLITCQCLEKQLQMASSEVMKFLNPQFNLIGSVAEDTKIGPATEMDITLKFTGMEKYPFRLGASATELLLPENKEAQILHQFSYDGTNGVAFNYTKFQNFLLSSISDALKNIHLPPNLKVCTYNSVNGESSLCSKCIKTSMRITDRIYVPNTHCQTCSPVVTQTKIGPCLVFKSRNEDDLLFATIDLVPVYPVEAPSSMHLFTNVFRTLVEERPPFWLDYFNSLIKRDIILPEAFENGCNKKESTPIPYVAIKLLHYGPEPNYMIRPGQEMEIEQFHSNELLKNIYIHMNCCKWMLNLTS